MSKLVVTGANGYIGSHVIKALQNKNIDFIATDSYSGNISNDVEIFECDLFNEKNMYEKMGHPDTILHLAWNNGFVHNASNHMLDLSKHFKFLTEMIDSGVKQVCVMGSMHEVGYQVGAINENTPVNPLSQYAIAKNALRQALELYCRDRGVVFQWIRGFYIYGDDIYGKSIFAKLQLAAKEKKTTFPFTTGKNKYDFIHINDLANQIVAVISQTEITGIINCCSGKPKSLAEQVEWYIQKYKLNIRLEYGVFPDREYDSPCIWGDDAKIKQILNCYNNKE